MQWTITLENIHLFAKAFWQQFDNKGVFAFHGEMGSGKTTLIHALCDVKNVTSTVGSPTFSIINEYEFAGGKIFHIDLYRLKDEEEVLRAGVEDCFYSGEACFVEWPEKAGELLPPNSLHLFISTIDPFTRKIRTGPA
jgi:tRNA threonylcarbamoyladenosine biosynthesis protein TsaE